MNPQTFTETPPAPADASVESSLLTPRADSVPRRGPAEVLILSLAVALYCALSFHILRTGLRLTNHELTYPLDDTYITMAIAKNFALHGRWSVSSARFVSSTSCPGFVLLLAAAFRLTGPSVWWPLALSFGFGLCAILMAQRLLLATSGLATQCIALFALVLFTPLAVVGLIGMEHTAHLFLVLAFLYLASESLAQQKSPRAGLLLLAAAAVSLRYESLFLVGTAALLYLAQRQVRAAFSLGAAAAAPVVVYGAISVWNGCYWLPHTVALKGLSGSAALHSPLAPFLHFVDCLARAPHMLPVLGATIAPLISRHVRQNVRVCSILLMALWTTVLHLSFADVNWVYRYESYLIGASITAVACAVPLLKIRRDWLAVAVLAGCGVLGLRLLAQRTLQAQGSLPFRSLAIYSQQVQMARFLSRYYQHAAVAANDIGAITFYANVDCLDLMGLGDKTVFWLRRNAAFSTNAMAALSAERHVKVAIVYDTWFTPGALLPPIAPPLPASWIRVQRWTTPYGFYLGGGTVSFYATRTSDVDELKRSLADYAPSLPAGVAIDDQ